VQVNSSRFAVAERVDVIVDFTGEAGQDVLSREPSGAARRSRSDGKCSGRWPGNKILKIVVDGPVVPTTASIRQYSGANHLLLRFPNTTMRRASLAPSGSSEATVSGRSTVSLSAVATQRRASRLNETPWRSGSSRTTRADGNIRSTCTSRSSRPFRSTVTRRQVRDHSERPERRFQVGAQHGSAGLLPLPRLRRQVPAALSQRGSRRPRHDGARHHRRRRRQQDATVAVVVFPRTCCAPGNLDS
jgi:hypothetical protein